MTTINNYANGSASRSNNFYLALLLTMLFLCVLPVGYAIVWLNPSWHCGPFSKHERIYYIFTDTLRSALPLEMQMPLDYISSPSTVIPLLLLLILVIYYLVSLTGALREANQDLRVQLRRERTEGRKKMLRLPKQEEEDAANTGNVLERWRKVMEASSPVSPPIGGGVVSAGGITGSEQPPLEDDAALKNNARKELLARIMKKAIRKGSNTSDDDSQPVGAMAAGDDETDTEQHESLPHDMEPVVRPALLPLKRPLFKQLARRAAVDKTLNTNQVVKKAKTAKVDRVTAAAAPNKSQPDSMLGRFKVEMVAETKPAQQSPAAHEADDDIECPTRVVRERRRSLLRQRNLTDGNNANNSVGGLLADVESRCSFEIIDEKSIGDRRTVRDGCEDPETSRNELPDLSDDDNTSYREMTSQKLDNSISNIAIRSAGSSNETSWNNELPGTGAQQVQSLPDQPAQPDALTSNLVTESKISKTPQKIKKKNNEEPVGKPNRRFNSFMALVREVVNIKKQDSQPESSNEPADVGDDAISPPVLNRRRESAGMRQSLRRKSRVHATAMRQDSQNSIWSDNIPVITISKTESDECILEARERIGAVPEQCNNLDIESD